ncbi:uncharacterized protein KY384_001791 [Bacidia gigantensis]|uniref:uncharacterized protein n=1 Tax=Bacidia gigantensis TaxID=2732470 RepID=UPI001D0435F4|nr:uncharacterized protein KY384_001791 [Bacidia gigantensis]KAG8533009.1 hypothetical protein KY384_001791 [Bacidia gigantensis]
MLFTVQLLPDGESTPFGSSNVVQESKSLLLNNDKLRHQSPHLEIDDLSLTSLSITKEEDQTQMGYSISFSIYGNPTTATVHADLVHKERLRYSSCSSKDTKDIGPVNINHGSSIYLGDVVAVARYRKVVGVKDKDAAILRVTATVNALRASLKDGHSLYGVTTGFGGSADTRTGNTYDLQRALLQHQNSGILPSSMKPDHILAQLQASPHVTFMPEQWVRGAMLVRCKSLLNGDSAIRWEMIDVLMTMLNKNLIPLVPLRGSISASGDLQPLSYIAGTIEGNPDIWVWADNNHRKRDLISASSALKRAGFKPQRLGPKEGLAVLNGTAFSTAVGALALHDAHQLALLSQLLTAMDVEALSGAVGSFDPFFAQVRPHPGQAEAAKHIRLLLSGSHLARDEDESENEDRELKQDRYSIRTASQWIGPVLEDLCLAHGQISTECNSTTDNPLMDPSNSTMHHGGNFQALSITSAMEKTRQGLQLLGRMLFAQCTELMNPATNNGLPPNLAADEPSTSYTFKGCDINMAAYMSELAFLANPVSTHVQTAEMGNQALNSLALISARYTHQAVEIVMQMCAVYIYALCQALDLRAIDIEFRSKAKLLIHSFTNEAFRSALQNPEDRETLGDKIEAFVMKQLPSTTSMDSGPRFAHITALAQSTVMTYLYSLAHDRRDETTDLVDILGQFTPLLAGRLQELFVKNREAYFVHPSAHPYLGRGSDGLYIYVRHQLNVPFHKGLGDCPTAKNGLLTLGGYVSVIFESLREGGKGGEGGGVV